MYDCKILKPEDLNMIPKRKKDSNKGSFKKLLIIAGSKGMSGAAYLSAYAAYRTGAGIVNIFTHESNRQILQSMLPEAIISSYDKYDFSDNYKNFIIKINRMLSWADIAVTGPGLGTEDYVYTLVKQALMHKAIPIVVDADALNCIGANTDLLQYLHKDIVITPHPKEMSRLTGTPTGQIIEEPYKSALSYSLNNNVNTVLKLHNTLTVSYDAHIYKNMSGTPALAKAGSGDVLTGIIAGLFCVGLDIVMAAALGVYIHGLAGTEAEKKYGEHGVLARDTIECIPSVMKMPV